MADWDKRNSTPLLQENEASELMTKVQNQFSALKKLITTIRNGARPIENGEMSQETWNDSGRELLNTIDKYDKQVINITQILGALTGLYVDNDPEFKSRRDLICNKIKKELDDLEKEIPGHIYAIKKYNMNNSNPFSESDPGHGQARDSRLSNQLTLIEVENNDKFLAKRREELQKIYQLSSKMKDMSELLAVQVNEQGEQIDSIEHNVQESNKNADAAKEEIEKANQTSKSNRNRMLCLILIALCVVGGITAIILSLVL